jgi:hypothetical protein
MLMPRLQIIALDRPTRTDPNSFRYVLWADVPVERQRFFAQPDAVSAWLDALPADNAALASGAVTEIVGTIQIPAGAGLAQIKTFLQSRHAAFQDEITNNNLWVRYGTTFDGTTWVDGGVA